MKQSVSAVLLLTAILAGGVSLAQAAPPPDPWEIIIHESMRENCDMAGKAPAGQQPPAAHAGQAMGDGGERHMAGEMHGMPGMPCGGRGDMDAARSGPMGPHHPDCIPCVMKILGLTDAQKKQIAAIAKDDRDKAVASMEKREEIRRQLRQAERAGTFDEKAVRSLAGKLAQMETDMIVARAKVHSRINTVLTPVQRVIVERMEPEMPCPPGPPPAGTDEQ